MLKTLTNLLIGLALLFGIYLCFWSFYDPLSRGSDVLEMSRASNSLENCPTNEVRLYWYPEGSFASAVIDLARQTVGYRYWNLHSAVDSDLRGTPLPDLTDQQVIQVRDILDRLPVRERPFYSGSSAQFKNDCHIAFNDRGHVRVYDYPEDNLPPQAVELLKVAGLYDFYAEAFR